jgi:O-antigen/teichoic acid export membrane protein
MIEAVHAAHERLSVRAARAAKWRFAGAIVGGASQFAIGILLARLLAPDDFGLVALAFVVLGLAQPFGDLGLGGALIQRASLTDRHVRAAFTLSALFGLGIAALMVAAAPLGAAAMGDPRVTPVLRVLPLGLALQSTALAADALLRRRLAFERLFVIDVGSHVVGYGGVAVALALSGYGVWSWCGAGSSRAC